MASSYPYPHKYTNITSLSLFLVAFIVLGIAGNRSADWPPQRFFEVFDVPSAIAVCRDKFSINEEHVLAFENAPNIVEAPNDRKLQCYMHCMLSGMGLMEGTTLNFRKLIHMVDELSPTQQQRFFSLGKGCVPQSTDPCQKAFDLMSCWKRNSNEDFFLF